MIRTDRKEGSAESPSAMADLAAMEQVILEMVVDLLKVPRDALDRDWISLGGDSLKAVWFSRVVERRFGIVIPLAALFDAPSTASLIQGIAADVAGHSAHLSTNK